LDGDFLERSTLMDGRTNYEQMRQAYLGRLSRQAGGGGDDRYWKPEIGKRYAVRFLPPIPGQELFYIPYGVHYIEGAVEDIVITCAKLTVKQPCPACELARQLFRGTEQDKDWGKKIYAKKRFCANVVVVSSAPSEVKLWAFGPQVMDQLAEIVGGEQGDFIPIDDPERGLTLRITVTKKQTGQKVYPNYIVTAASPPSPLPDMSVLQQLHDYASIIIGNVEPYEVVDAKLKGGIAGEGSDEELPPDALPPSPPPAPRTVTPAQAVRSLAQAPAGPKAPPQTRVAVRPAASVAKPSQAPPPPPPPQEEQPPAEEEVVEEEIVDDGAPQEANPNAPQVQAQAASQAKPAAGGGGDFIARARAALAKKRPPGQ